MRLKGKLILNFLIVSLIPTIIILVVVFFNFSSLLKENILQSQYYDVKIKEEKIVTFLDLIEEDVLFLSNLSSLNSFVNSFNYESYLESKNNLENDFFKFSNDKKIYSQVRLLNEEGKEVVRVDREGNKTFLVSDSDLQNKFDRYYFKDAIKLRKGEVLTSPLDLNIENGGLENRGDENNPIYVPTIRYYTPVFNDKNEKEGVLILNVYAENFLNFLSDNISNIENRDIFLTNKDGYYLYNEDKEREWSFMFSDLDYKMNKCGSLDNVFLSSFEKEHFEETESDYFSVIKIKPHFLDENILSSLGVNNDEYWLLVSKVSKSDLYKNIYNTFFRVLILILLAILVVIFLAYLLFKSIFKPIKKLSEGAKIIAEGNLDYNVDIESRDEIGDLANDFNIMANSLKSLKENIDGKVKKRTEELEKLNKSMVKRELKMIELKKEIKRLNIEKK